MTTLSIESTQNNSSKNDYLSRFNEWESHVESQAEWLEVLSDNRNLKKRHPDLWDRFLKTFVFPREYENHNVRRSKKRIWYPGKPDHLFGDLIKHLERSGTTWVGLPYKKRTRTVTIDIDNHDDILLDNFHGLSVAYLKRLKATWEALGREPWMWSITSKTYGINVILDLRHSADSQHVHDHFKRILAEHGLDAEVYPWGAKNHRLPFGEDWVAFDDQGPLTWVDDQLAYFFSNRICPSWETIFDCLVTTWLVDAERFAQGTLARQKLVKGRLDAINEWEMEGFPVDRPEQADEEPISTPEPVSIISAPTSRPPCPSWKGYTERFASGQGKWIRLVVDLATHGVPVEDCLDSAVMELGKWLYFVELHDLGEELRLPRVLRLVSEWLCSKHNGNVSRINEGDKSVFAQVERLVKLIARSEDFNGLFANIRAKRSSNCYSEVIQVIPLMAASRGPEGFFRGEAEKRPEGGGREEKIGITYTSVFLPALEPLLAKKQDARQRQLTFISRTIDHLRANGNQGTISQEIARRFGYEHENQQDRTLKMIVDANLITRTSGGRWKARTYRLTDETINTLDRMMIDQESQEGTQ